MLLNALTSWGWWFIWLIKNKLGHLLGRAYSQEEDFY
jgi:hypothetical protein